MKSRVKALDWFLGALAVGAALGVLFKREHRSVTPALETAGPKALLPGKEWAGSLARMIRCEIRESETVIIAAALSFYAILAILPAAIAAVSIYGLVLDPVDLANQIKTVTDFLPQDARELVTSEIERLAETSATGLTLGLLVSLPSMLWVASSGTRSLLHGIHLVHNVEERRPWLTQRALAYGFTIGMIVFALSTVAVVTFLPGWLEDLGLGTSGVLVVKIARWPAILTVVALGLAALYHIAPNLPSRKGHRLFPGAITAALLWLLATLGFSLYTGSALSSFDVGTYGTLVSVVVLLAWFFVSGFVVLLGAEINVTLEAHDAAR